MKYDLQAIKARIADGSELHVGIINVNEGIYAFRFNEEPWEHISEQRHSILAKLSYDEFLRREEVRKAALPVYEARALVCNGEFILLGTPDDSIDHHHNCDQMGCPSAPASHIITRVNIPPDIERMATDGLTPIEQ